MKTRGFIPWIADKLALPVEISETNLHVATAVFVLVVITIISFLAWRKFRNVEENIIPSDKPSFSTIFEIAVESILNLMEGIMGPSAKKHLPFIGSLFIYIFISNIIGVIPGFVPPTSNINTNLACALCVFLYYNYMGIQANGVLKYLKHMSGPIIWLAPLMFAIELVSHLVRPLSLSVRLFGNMTGDHIVLGMFSSLIPLFVPIIFMGLTIFVAFIQAFVFSLLSIVYISLATEH